MAKVMCSVWCLVLLLCLVGFSFGDLQADEKECQKQLQSLTSCFDFVQGQSKKPSQECCSNLKEVRASKPKCLCVLIKDSSNPSLGFSINQTLALEMPSICKVDAKSSDCPALLNLSPNSPEAKIFGTGNSSSASPSSHGSSTSTTPSTSNSLSLISKSQLGLGMAGALVAIISTFVL
eukprot:Gb_24349 [translate_table: standard]